MLVKLLLAKIMIKKFIVFIITLILVTLSMSYIFADEISINYNPEEVNIESSNTSFQVVKISANDTTGLHSIILRLIGDYNPIVKDYTYTSSSGYTTHSIDIQPDWSWIMSCALFIIVIWSLFRFLGGVFNG